MLLSFFFFHSRCHCYLFIYSGNRGVCLCFVHQNLHVLFKINNTTETQGSGGKPGVNSGATQSLLPGEQKKILERQRRYQASHREQIRERRRHHRQTHRERIREYSRRYYYTRRRRELGSCLLEGLATDACPSHIIDTTSGGWHLSKYGL